MKSRTVAVGLAGLAVSLCATRAQALPDYSQPGPLSYATSALATDDGGVQGGDLVVPNGSGPYPLLVASHGWSATSAQQLGWAEHFATYGFVVVVPTFPNTLDPDATADANIIAEQIALYTNPATSSPAQGLVDPARVGVEGHSAGGLASTLAAYQLHLGATVLFDPVDANDAGRAAYASLCGPVLALFADPSSCNNEAEWSSFATDTTATSTTFHVVGSTHCDGEDPDRGELCGLVCNGVAEATRQAVYARYATAFFLANLNGDPVAASALAPIALAADTTIATITSASGTSCAPLFDGGGGNSPPPGDGTGQEDAGEASPQPGSPTAPPRDDASVGESPTSPGSPAGGGAGTAGSSSGCGCSLSSTRGPSMSLLFAVGALAIARRRSQRKR
jgi:dienelactone hydrolase